MIDIMDQCYMAGGHARRQGIGIRQDGSYDYAEKKTLAAECAHACGAAPGAEFEDAVESWQEGWNAEDERLHTLETDLRAYRSQYGDKGID